jgi:hypothetical protein
MPRLLVALAVAAIASGPVAAADPPTRRPNIVLIFADDLGWRDAGYQGSDFHETPHIDALARRGMACRQPGPMLRRSASTARRMIPGRAG